MIRLSSISRNRRKRGLVASAVAAAVALALWAGGTAIYYRDYPVHHFATVVPGVLYRSAQPTERGWRALRDEYGIRTVIDLRRDEPQAEWSILQNRFCRENGIALERIVLRGDRPTDEQLEQFLAIVRDPERQPVLVHCELGSSRTGVMTAAYRIAEQGWTSRQAIEESGEYKKDIVPGYRRFLEELAAKKDGQGRGQNVSSTFAP